MCGRYIVSDESSQMRTYLQITNINSGDVYPASMAPVLMDQNDNLTPKAVKWGVNGFKKSSVIINARAETALEKPFFKNDLILNRCVVLSTGFYEWQNHKQKYMFKTDDSDMVYMAGFIKKSGQNDAFVILTTSANSSMEKYHDRMPVILKPDECKLWVYDPDFFKKALSRTGPQLKAIKMPAQ